MSVYITEAEQRILNGTWREWWASQDVKPYCTLDTQKSNSEQIVCSCGECFLTIEEWGKHACHRAAQINASKTDVDRRD